MKNAFIGEVLQDFHVDRLEEEKNMKKKFPNEFTRESMTHFVGKSCLDDLRRVSRMLKEGKKVIWEIS
jgi:hypothetical protein